MPRSDGELTESLLIITGAMGAGKTAVLGEASDALSIPILRSIAVEYVFGARHPAEYDPESFQFY
jgi:predicted ATP-binding protein involved in virulence